MNEIMSNQLYDGTLFYGEKGSRKKVIKGLADWIDKSKQYSTTLIGVVEIGKSTLLRHFLEHLNPEVPFYFFTDQYADLLDEASNFICTLDNSITEFPSEYNRSRHERFKLLLGGAIESKDIIEVWSILTNWIIHLKRYEIVPKVVFVFDFERLGEEIETELRARTAILAGNGIKIILEERQRKDAPTLGSAKQDRISRTLGPFERQEARKFILGEHPSNKIDDVNYEYPPYLTSAENKTNRIPDTLIRHVGCHPGLLARLSKSLITLTESSIDTTDEDTLVKVAFSECEIKEQIKVLLETVKEEDHKLYSYLVKLVYSSTEFEEENCTRLKMHYALIHKTPSGKSKENWEIPQLVKDVIKGESEMELLMLITNYAQSKATTFAKSQFEGALRSMWEEIYPPTPLYIAALQAAAKEVKESWSNRDLPDNVDFIINVLRELEIKNVDSKKAKALPSVSQEQIKSELLNHIGVDKSEERIERFVTQVVDVAEQKYRDAIILGNREESAPLLRQYIMHSLDQLGEAGIDREQKQKEILAKLLEIDSKLEIWFPNSQRSQDQLLTLDEVYPLQKTQRITNIIDEEVAKIENDDPIPSASKEWVLQNFNRTKDRITNLYKILDIRDTHYYAADLKAETIETPDSLDMQGERQKRVKEKEGEITQAILKMYALASLIDRF